VKESERGRERIKAERGRGRERNCESKRKIKA
jgi:hypothetical protein